MLKINSIAIVGVGLIGGSTALGLKRGGLVGEVLGVGRNHASLAEAIGLGVIEDRKSVV